MSATRVEARPKFNTAALNDEIMRLRTVDHVTNLGFLAFEYASIAVVIGGAVAFRHWRSRSGLPWLWDVPVLALGVVLVGAIQHRLAGLGHEAAHYSLLKNKRLNDLVGDVFCMFPILATVHFYRLFHLAHHQYTNDPERDPDLVTLGESKMVDRFPMSRWEFIKATYLRIFTDPMAFIRYQQDYIDINVLGRTDNVYVRQGFGGNRTGRIWPRLGSALGLAYIFGFIVLGWITTWLGKPHWLVPAGLLGTLLVLAGSRVLPRSAFFESPFRQPYSGRTAGVLRLICYTWFCVAIALLRTATAGEASFYFWVLWVIPWVTSLPFFMLLRDTYQHTNADDGRLTNTRVFFTDPLTRWAVFVYGQDMHVPHHLFPAIPHHRLGRLHRLLKDRHAEYAATVVECDGTFTNASGRPTIVDTLTTPRAEGRQERLPSIRGSASDVCTTRASG